MGVATAALDATSIVGGLLGPLLSLVQQAIAEQNIQVAAGKIGFYGVSRTVNGYKVPHFQVLLGGQWENNAGSYGLPIIAIPSKRAPDAVELREILVSTYDKAGLADFYKGDVAKTLLQDVRNVGGVLNAADLANCQARIFPATEYRWRGRTLQLTGGLTAAVPLKPGSYVSASFGHLGTVTVRGV